MIRLQSMSTWPCRPYSYREQVHDRPHQFQEKMFVLMPCEQMTNEKQYSTADFVRIQLYPLSTREISWIHHYRHDMRKCLVDIYRRTATISNSLSTLLLRNKSIDDLRHRILSNTFFLPLSVTLRLVSLFPIEEWCNCVSVRTRTWKQSATNSMYVPASASMCKLERTGKISLSTLPLTLERH
jgi:hypothetical protein